MNTESMISLWYDHRYFRYDSTFLWLNSIQQLLHPGVQSIPQNHNLADKLNHNLAAQLNHSLTTKLNRALSIWLCKT